MSGWGQAHINNTIGFGGGVSCGGFTGLLDEYSGAAAAYSLRQLSSSYAGSAIRVRRSSDNAEQDIGFVNNELDTASLLSFVGAGDGFVTTWYDQSGSSNNATQASAANQPRIVSGGSLILENGKPALNFDGLDWLNTSLPFQNDYLTFNVHRWSGIGSFPVQIGSDLSNNRIALINGISNLHYQFYGVLTIQAAVGTYTPNTQYLSTITKKHDSTSGFYRQNGVVLDSNSNITSNVTANIRIGADNAGFRHNGTIQEINFYPFTESQVNNIETNINSFYSIY